MFFPGILTQGTGRSETIVSLVGDNGTFTDSGGATAGYQNNELKRWRISASAPIRLTFNSFDTEEGYDFIKIYDGYNTKSPLLLKHSGDTIPDPIVSTGNYLFITFVSDTSVRSPGWVANWELAYILLSGDSGTFTDTGGTGGNYQNNESKKWRIAASQPIRLTFSYFNTEGSIDILRIYDGTNANAPLLLTHSGNTTPGSVTSTGNDLFITFTSDLSITGFGWLATWKPAPTLTQLAGDSGNLLPVLVAGNYRNNREDAWRISASVPIRLTFNSFNTEFGFDTLKIYDGIDENAPLVLTHSGNSMPNPAHINSTGNDLYLKFTTDATITNSGWVANWQPQPAFTLLTANSGTFTDSGGAGGNYQNNETLYWKIKPANAQAVKLTFTAISIFAGDSLTIYDGEDELSPILLNNYSGTTLPPEIKATGNVLFIKFVSDAASVGSGWVANWSQNTDFTLITAIPSNIQTFYGNNNLARWHIQGSLRSKLTFAVPNSNIEDGVDFLSLYDGNSQSSPLILNHTGVNPSATLSSSSRSLFVRFASDSSVTGFFNFVFKYLKETILASNSGSFSKPTPYEVNAIYTWIIAAKAPIRLTFNFSQTSVAIFVYDGIGDSSPSLLQYSGSTPPPPINSTGNHLTIKLIPYVVGGTNNALASWQLQN